MRKSCIVKNLNSHHCDRQITHWEVVPIRSNGWLISWSSSSCIFHSKTNGPCHVRAIPQQVKVPYFLNLLTYRRHSAATSNGHLRLLPLGLQIVTTWLRKLSSGTAMQANGPRWAGQEAGQSVVSYLWSVINPQGCACMCAWACLRLYLYENQLEFKSEDEKWWEQPTPPLFHLPNTVCPQMSL